MESPEQHHTLHLLEPLDSCQKSLWERLFARTYAKPFIIDCELQRRLQFDLTQAPRGTLPARAALIIRRLRDHHHLGTCDFIVPDERSGRKVQRGLDAALKVRAEQQLIARYNRLAKTGFV
jgi:hypothetical protein